MRRIIQKIEEAKRSLAKGKLFKWLSDESIDGYQRLSFTPSMLYYIMGFKDVLDSLKREHPTNRLDKIINAYCGEDAEHWRWFLTDLEKIGYKINTWGNTISDWCNDVWGTSNQINRKTIFDLIYYAKAENDPLYALCIIMVFEATGVIFIGHTRKAAIAIGMDGTLDYFGKKHYEEEFGHSAKASDFENIKLDDLVLAKTDRMVDELTTSYHLLFDCWYEHRNRYGYQAHS